MVSLTQLWIPILLSAVAVFLASSVIHMMSPWHKSDFPRLSNEDAVMDALRPFAIPPGDYFFPKPASMEDMKSAEFAAKTERGPKIVMTVMKNGMAPMGPIFVQWFIYLLIVSALAGHLASRAVPQGADGHHAFHQTALVAFAAYAMALWQLSIWYSRSWSITIKTSVDALIYALITGAIFGWFWP